MGLVISFCCPGEENESDPEDVYGVNPSENTPLLREGSQRGQINEVRGRMSSEGALPGMDSDRLGMDRGGESQSGQGDPQSPTVNEEHQQLNTVVIDTIRDFMDVTGMRNRNSQSMSQGVGANGQMEVADVESKAVMLGKKLSSKSSRVKSTQSKSLTNGLVDVGPDMEKMNHQTANEVLNEADQLLVGEVATRANDAVVDNEDFAIQHVERCIVPFSKDEVR